MILRITLSSCIALCFAGNCLPDPAHDLSQPLTAIHAVGPEGQGNAQASTAWKTLAAGDADTLPALLRGMEGANSLAANWIQAAVETIADRELSANHALPLPELGELLLNTKNDPRARHFAYELINRVDPKTAAQLLGGMLNDPSGPLKRLAVDVVIRQAEEARAAENKTGAVLLYQQALSFARAPDQLQTITKPLADLGQKVDIQDLFGFLTRWKVIGPFDSTAGTGFSKVYPPETEIDFTAHYKGKTGQVGWSDLVTDDDYGNVDLNQPFGKLKEVAAYAHTEFHSLREQPAELRLGCKNAWKIWFNGKLLFGRDEYHRGKEIDQYRLPVTLKSGPNSILVKACQNEMTESWTVEWDFQLRICDPLGTPIHSTPQTAAAVSNN